MDPGGARILWADYTDFNEDMLFSVPILRLKFKMGEKTFLESGVQFMRAFNNLVREDSYSKVTTVTQIVNNTIIRGYNVSLLFGFSNFALNYDVNRQHEVLLYGSDSNTRHVNIFCKIYAGMIQ